jgi:uncharacterized protein involved in propanediol utilization
LNGTKRSINTVAGVAPPSLACLPDSKIAAESVIGLGRSIGHHGEILQGAFLDPTGHTVPGLVTVPCSALETRARFVGLNGSIEIEDDGRGGSPKTRRAVRLALDALGIPGDRGGRLQLHSNIERRLGLGSSTADVVAAIRAVADAHRHTPTADEIARLAVAAEGAADPLMFDCPDGVLFAQRSGWVLEKFARPLPAMALLSIDTDPGGDGIDTISHPVPHYSSRELTSLERLRRELRGALERQDLHSVATVATASAYLNHRYLPKPRFEEIIGIGFRAGAVGIQVAHSGSVVGLMFDPQDFMLEAHVTECEEKCRRLGLSKTRRLEVGGVASFGRYARPSRDESA